MNLCNKNTIVSNITMANQSTTIITRILNSQSCVVTKLFSNICKLENDVKQMIDERSQTCTNSCPVCIEDVGTCNYLVFACGHIMCMNCFVISIRKNTLYSKKCSLCRSIIHKDL